MNKIDRRNIVIVIILMLYADISFSQNELSDQNIIYKAKFDSPQDMFCSYDRQKSSQRIFANGKMTIVNNSHIMELAVVPAYVNFNKNFSIKTTVKQISGAYNKGYGIVWGSQSWQNSYAFFISKSKYFCIGSWRNGVYYPVKNWTASSAIKSYGQADELRVEKNGRNLNCYINKTKVFTSRCLEIYGQFHGVVIKKGAGVEFSQFEIIGGDSKINLAAITSSNKKTPLHDNVNTKKGEIAPVLSSDGKTLWFARVGHPSNYGDDNDCDIWFSKVNADGSFSPAVNAGKPLNNAGINVVIKALANDETLYLEGLYNSDGSHKSRMGISKSVRSGNTWTVPQEVKIRDFINNNVHSTYSISNDTKILIMSVERPEGFGGLDLYVSFLQADGTYSKPMNLGPEINTYADDGTPFLASDNTTLFFSSFGFPGYGSNDIFMSRRTGNLWTDWSIPINLGPCVNSSQWDSYFSMSNNGNVAFSVSDTPDKSEEIYIFNPDNYIKPVFANVISGVVVDSKTSNPLLSRIICSDASTGKVIFQSATDDKGSYYISLKSGIKYRILAQFPGYMPESKYLDLSVSGKSHKEFQMNFALKKIYRDSVIVFDNLLFDRAGYNILPESYSELDDFAELLTQNSAMRVCIEGHTDSNGKNDDLLLLSIRRAQIVKKYLTDKGIDGSRIICKGFGCTRPVSTDKTEADRKKNRRVEFRILQN